MIRFFLECIDHVNARIDTVDSVQNDKNNKNRKNYSAPKNEKGNIYKWKKRLYTL